MNIKTSKDAKWVNAHTNPHPTGKNVLALTRGGKLIETIWTTETIKTCDAFMDYPKIPSDIRELQSYRYINGE